GNMPASASIMLALPFHRAIASSTYAYARDFGERGHSARCDRHVAGQRPLTYGNFGKALCPLLSFNAEWPPSTKITAKRPLMQCAIGRSKSRPRKPTAVLRNESATKNGKAFFGAWEKRKSVMRSVGKQR